jgi:hypothetical protein
MVVLGRAWPLRQSTVIGTYLFVHSAELPVGICTHMLVTGPLYVISVLRRGWYCTTLPCYLSVASTHLNECNLTSCLILHIWAN